MIQLKQRWAPLALYTVILVSTDCKSEIYQIITSLIVMGKYVGYDYEIQELQVPPYDMEWGKNYYLISI